jgi:hypothetical protein
MDKIDMTDAQRKARRSRSVAIGLALAAMAIIFYVAAIVRMMPAS